MSLPSTERILRRDEVSRRVGLKKSAIYALITQGGFPQPVKLGPRAVGWLESEVNAWIEGRIQESRSAARAR